MEKILIVDKDFDEKISWLPGETEDYFPVEKYQVKVVNIKPDALDYLCINPDTSVVFLDYRKYNEVDYANISEIIQHIRSVNEIKHIPIITIVSMPDDRLSRGVLNNGSDYIVYKESIKNDEGSVKIFNHILKRFLEFSSLRKNKLQQ